MPTFNVYLNSNKVPMFTKKCHQQHSYVTADKGRLSRIRTHNKHKMTLILIGQHKIHAKFQGEFPFESSDRLINKYKWIIIVYFFKLFVFYSQFHLTAPGCLECIQESMFCVFLLKTALFWTFCLFGSDIISLSNRLRVWLLFQNASNHLFAECFFEIILVSFLLIALVLFKKNAPNNRLNHEDKAVCFNTDESGFLNLMTCFCLIKENQQYI